MNDAERRRIEEECDKAWQLWEKENCYEGNLLDRKKKKKGEIFSETIYQDSTKTVSLLTLSPGAKIREHLHLYDSEIYFDLKTGDVIGECKQFERHSLENPSNQYLFVLSIKTMGRR